MRGMNGVGKYVEALLSNGQEKSDLEREPQTVETEGFDDPRELITEGTVEDPISDARHRRNSHAGAPRELCSRPRIVADVHLPEPHTVAKEEALERSALVAPLGSVDDNFLCLAPVDHGRLLGTSVPREFHPLATCGELPEEVLNPL